MPDWGHGSNEPLPVWTEANIRGALKDHGPSNDGCSCSWGVGADHEQQFDADHVIDLLKLFHLGAS